MYKINHGFLLIAIVLFINGCRNNESDSTEEGGTNEVHLTPVTVVEVEKSDFFEFGEYYGRVQGVNRASVISVLGGTVESVSVVEGSIISKGDSLGLISSEKARIMLDSAILNEKISGENYQTLKKFLRSGSSSQISVDQAHLQWLNSKTQLIDARKAYDGAFCISPIDGVIVSRNIDEDNEIMAGHESFLVEDMSKIEIKIGIPEADMQGVKEGSPAEIFLDLYPDRVWKGSLVRFSRRSSDRNLTFSATIVVDNDDRTILSGTTAKVRLLRNSYLDYIVLPIDTVISEDNKNYVMVLDGDIVTKRYIELGKSSVTECVVLSGVDVGEVIIREGLHLLIDSQKVVVIDEEV